MRQFIMFVLGVGMCTVAVAQPTLDGSISSDGYARRVTQTVDTGFGDNQSELNAAYATIDGGNLYLALTGNIEANFNKLNIFIHTGAAGGQNTIGPATDEGGLNPNNDDWAENYSGVGPAASGNGNGFTFDSGFAANYLAIVRRGGSQFDFDFSSVGNASVVEGSGDIFAGALEGSNASVGASGIGVAYDGTNVAGVGAGTGAADETAANMVMTGLELAIPLSAIGNPDPADILVSAHVNNSNHDFLSNQSLGGFASGQDNLGGNGMGGFNNDVSLVNLNDYSGNQFFAVVPEPSSAFIALFLGIAGMVAMRRK